MTWSASGSTSGDASTTAGPRAAAPSGVAVSLSGPSSTTRLSPPSPNSRSAAASAASAASVVGVSKRMSTPTTAAPLLAMPRMTRAR